MFWCTAPFWVAAIVLLPLLARPPEMTGWIALGAFELLAVFALLGFYDADRFNWCWRIVGGIVFTGYCSYLISMIAAGQWFGDGRRSSTNALNAFIGLVVFGYPGFMYAVFGRIAWHTESKENGSHDHLSEADKPGCESDAR